MYYIDHKNDYTLKKIIFVMLGLRVSLNLALITLPEVSENEIIS